MRKLFATSLLLMYMSSLTPMIFAEDFVDATIQDASTQFTQELQQELQSASVQHKYTSTNPMECLLTKWMIEGNGMISLDTLNRYYHDMSLACQDESSLNSASESELTEDVSTDTASISEFSCGDDIVYGEFTYSTTLMPDDTCWTSTSMKHLSGTGDSWNYGDITANLPINETGSTLGRLYTWYAAMGIAEGSGSTSTGETSSGVCALLGDGWSLPTDDDWSSLEISGATGWMGNQALGIAADLPGARTEDGVFSFIDELGFWWTQSSTTPKTATTRSIDRTDFLIYSNDYTVASALSVHCIKK